MCCLKSDFYTGGKPQMQILALFYQDLSLKIKMSSRMRGRGIYFLRRRTSFSKASLLMNESQTMIWEKGTGGVSFW
jgi:hypothetical protein